MHVTSPSAGAAVAPPTDTGFSVNAAKEHTKIDCTKRFDKKPQCTTLGPNAASLCEKRQHSPLSSLDLRHRQRLCVRVPWVRRRAARYGLCVSLCLSVRVLLVADSSFPLTIGTIAVMLMQHSLRAIVKSSRLTSTASRSGPPTSGYEAAAMSWAKFCQARPRKPVCSPMDSSQYGADVAVESTAPAAESQSVADAEMAAALQRAAGEIGVVWVPPPSPEPSRLDDWFLGRGRDSRPRSAPVPFFPEVHEELTKSWKAPLSARPRCANSPSLTTLDGGPARGYTEVPQVERAIAMHLCPQNAASWRGCPRLPSRACKFSSTLVARAYAASGQAASALHAMAILQVYQAKVLKDLHEGVPDPELLHELRSATNYALRATKVTAQALGRVMSTMVVQERHLWLNLAEMRDAEKVRFLDAPISQAGLFGETVEEFARQFSTVKQQAIKHILPRRAASASPAPPRQQPPPAKDPLRERLRPRNPPILQPGPPNGPALVERLLRTLQPREEGSFDLGRALDSATTWSTKEQFPPSLGVMCSISDPPLDGRMLYPSLRTCGHTEPVFPHVPAQQARSIDSPSQRNPLSSFHSLISLDKTIGGVRGFLPPATRLCSSHQAPILGKSGVVPLRPLAEKFSDWLNLPNPSRWILRTIRLGYAIQFARRLPRFRGVLTTSVAKDAIETVPSAEMKKGFYSPYFIVPKKGDGLRPILDLRALNRALLKLPFKMLPLKRIITCIRPQDWFVAIDLKDAYFHVSILPRHRPFLRFAFEGRAYQYKVLPFGLSLSPRVFTKVAEAALAPLREVGIRILNYLGDWLILAHSWDLVCAHRDVVLNHLAQLGLQVNWEKSKLSPVQRISFLGIELNSVSMNARLSPERAQCGSAVLRLLGHMASSAAATPLGLMHMRPLQHWLHTRVPRWAWHRGTFRVNITPSCRKTLSPWTDMAFLRSGVPLEQVSRCIVVTTDASKTGWGAVCNGQAASGVWLCPRLLWHINCLELLTVLLALRRFRPLIQGKHVLVRSDNTATVAYINHQGGVRSFRMSQLARHLLLSLRATHIPGEANHMADSLRVEAPPSLGPTDLGSIRPGTSRPLCLTRIHPLPVVVRRTGTHMRSPQQGTDSLGSPLLAQQNLVPRPGAPGISSSLAHSSEEGPPLSGEGHNLAPAPRSLEPPPMVPGRDQEDFRDLPPSVVNTLLQARAPSTRRLYDLKWRIFVNWCSSQGKDPRRCGIESVLSFLQEGLDRHLSASTLKVHVAAISANHDLVGDRSVGKHDLIIRFLRGARRLNPPRPNLIPSWDLAVVLQGLQQDPFEPLQSVKLDALSLKTTLLTALTSVKRVGDLQALSVDSSCLEFGPANSHVVPTTPFRDQVVTLQAISSQEDDPNLTLLCPVRALRIYIERTQHFRRSEQLFVCYGGQQKGKAVSKQRISHWLVDAIHRAYQARGLPCPLGVVISVVPLFLRETGTFPTFSRYSAAPLRKARLQDTAVTGQSLDVGWLREIRTSEQMRMLPYLYPDVRGVASYANSAHPIFIGLFQNCQRCLGSQERPLVSYTTRHNVSVPSIRE
ncbi:hypothetical protein M9458_051068 [Cirrhinus mrigala]|uniref:ribonuclease H n=1 Tax=Cirrhinus mrigala TaxID=683832 RepID=A0ABD0MZR3_CIRMR